VAWGVVSSVTSARGICGPDRAGVQQQAAGPRGGERDEYARSWSGYECGRGVVLGGVKSCPQGQVPFFRGRRRQVFLAVRVRGAARNGGEHGQGDVPVPGADLRTWYWSRPVSFFASASKSSNCPSGPGDGDELGQARAARGVHQK